MNHFEARLNLDIKERMLARQYTSYVDLYDTAMNVERAIKERNNYFNEQCRIKRKEDQQRSFHSQELYERPPGNYCSNNDACGGQHSNARPRVTCNDCGKSGHYA